MLDHVSITVSDIAAAERFYDAIMKELGVVKVGRREDWLGYGERSRPAYPERVYISIRKGGKPDELQTGIGVSRQSGGPRLMRSGTRGSLPAAATTARRACAATTRPITRRSCGIPTATGSRRSAIRRCETHQYRATTGLPKR
jgi:hypothetical protein